MYLYMAGHIIEYISQGQEILFVRHQKIGRNGFSTRRFRFELALVSIFGPMTLALVFTDVYANPR